MNEREPSLGKMKCKLLRGLRIKFAQQNNIEYHPLECHHQGDCKGTCPACDAELLFLKKMSEKLESEGVTINYN